MKSISFLAAVLILTTSAFAGENDTTNKDFSKSYREQIQAQTKTVVIKDKPSSEQLRREHIKYLREIARSDRHERD